MFFKNINPFTYTTFNEQNNPERTFKVKMLQMLTISSVCIYFYRSLKREKTEM